MNVVCVSNKTRPLVGEADTAPKSRTGFLPLNDPQIVQGLLRWASPKMMNVYDEAVALEKRTAHEKKLLNLTQRTPKHTAGEANFVSV